MTKHEALPEPTSFPSYDETQGDRLRSARTGIGLCIFGLALAATVPSVFEGLRGRPWISWPTMFCALLCAVNVLIYARYTARLRKLDSLEIAPNQHLSTTDQAKSGAGEAGGQR
jgi:hypothetical protein